MVKSVHVANWKQVAEWPGHGERKITNMGKTLNYKGSGDGMS